MSHTHTHTDITDYLFSTNKHAKMLYLAHAEHTDLNDGFLLLKLGDFADGTVASFLITINRTDGIGFTGYFTINCNSKYNVLNHKFNGIHSSYGIYRIEQGKILRLYQNADKTLSVYIQCPSFGIVSVLLFLPNISIWNNKKEDNITLTTVSNVAGTLIDSI